MIHITHSILWCAQAAEEFAQGGNSIELSNGHQFVAISFSEFQHLHHPCAKQPLQYSHKFLEQ